MELLKNGNDFSTSIEKAFYEIDKDWRNYVGIVALGTHSPTGVAHKLKRIKYARTHKVPFLGICMGMQLMAIEYARNVIGLEGANTQEIDPEASLIIKLPNVRVGIFKVDDRMETHWHNYKLNNLYLPLFKDWTITMTDGVVEEMMRNNMVGVQYHPEYQSSKQRPHPLLKSFLEICKQYTKLIPKI
jgi:CTP synthase